MDLTRFRFGARRRTLRSFALWLAFSLVSLGSTAGQTSQNQAPAGGTYRLGAGDSIEVVVWQNPEVSRTVTIRPDGWLSLPLINDVEVAGLTPMEVRGLLTKKLQDYISDPVVSVIVLQVSSFRVYALGKISSGEYVLKRPTTVLEVIAMAGGPAEFSSKDDIYILRPRGATYERIPFDYSEATDPKGKTVVVYVEPGDFVVVP